MRFFAAIMIWLALGAVVPAATPVDSNRPVYIIPIRDDIEESIVYVVRRGIKEAVDKNAQAVILDMNTNGGRGDAMEVIMELLENFKGDTITFVNKKAYSAGAFIAVATKHIYMAPSSVIGAAAPIMMSPSGGAEDVPSTMRKKISSAYAARIRAAAQRNGHNSAVVDSMVKETDGLTLDGKEIIKKGDILTLTDSEASALYGKPPKPLLAEGIAKDLSEVLGKFGYTEAQTRRVEPTGVERIARLITWISPVLLLIGLAGIYLEFKTPGITIFGFIGATALAIFFFGHYIAGLSGNEEILLFVVGLILIGIELLVLPGHVLPGFLGVVAILVSLLWAMVDKLPGPPSLPGMPQLQLPLAKLAGAMVGAAVVTALLARWLPKTKGPLGGLILQTQLANAAGYATAGDRASLVGQKGVSVSMLRPSGTARFGEQIMDVITEGDFVPAGQEIVVQEVHGAQVIVRKA
ncbi:MAG: ATP-dependent Clp protease proteolytic subunit [Verrucomicrobia bacterium]|nr:ATP-dependent Clp protease proteolytic subunit [Verrucomicrobiota bacterium]